MIDAGQTALWGFAGGSYLAAGGFRLGFLLALGNGREDITLRHDFNHHRSLPIGRRVALYCVVLLFVAGWPFFELIGAVHRSLNPELAE